MSFEFKNGMTEKLKLMKTKFHENDLKAKKACAIQLLTWTSTGSPKEKIVPPIKEGFLRGSGTVFVGDVFIGVDENNDNKYANKTGSEESNNDVITLGFNTPYAKKMHEHTGKWGEMSIQSVNVGNKFLERHIKNDCANILKLYAELYKKYMEKDMGVPQRKLA